MEKNKIEDKELLKGRLYIILVFTVWGFLPLYWKLLKQIPADEILAHRIIWSFVLVMTLLFFNKKLSSLREVIASKREMKYLFASTLFITINWFIYIWAVNSDHVVETSMGYYINPLIVIALSMIILKEKLNKWQIISITFAAIGVCILTIQYGKFPWIAISLATSFALYGLFKKLVNVDSIVGLAIETSLITPIALLYVLLKEFKGVGALGAISFGTVLLLVCTGLATAIPLIWFAIGAQRVSFSTVGFAQYISPTIMLIIGIFIFKEEFSGIHLVSFGFIWTGLIIYSLSQIGFLKNYKYPVKNEK